MLQPQLIDSCDFRSPKLAKGDEQEMSSKSEAQAEGDLDFGLFSQLPCHKTHVQLNGLSVRLAREW